VSYLFFCVAVADFVWDTIPSLLPKGTAILRGTVVSVTVFFGILAAVLSMGREYVSDYELYDASYVKLCEWVEKNTEPTDVLLTANNHNNAVASLTGRNIVCGSGTFLYYHGLNYGQAEADVKTMYEDPSRREELLRQYDVSYIVVGGWELGNYAISDLENMKQMYDVVYEQDGVVLLAVK